MIKILFVCYGNICRSPMAEFIFKKMVKERNLEKEFYIESAATSTEELGNPVYPPARRQLQKEGINCDGKRARQMKRQDYDRFDYIIGMDSLNIRTMHKITGGDPKQKIIKMLDMTDDKRDISDPWFTGDFEKTYNDIVKGCDAFLNMLGYRN